MFVQWKYPEKSMIATKISMIYKSDLFTRSILLGNSLNTLIWRIFHMQSLHIRLVDSSPWLAQRHQGKVGVQFEAQLVIVGSGDGGKMPTDATKHWGDAQEVWHQGASSCLFSKWRSYVFHHLAREKWGKNNSPKMMSIQCNLSYSWKDKKNKNMDPTGSKYKNTHRWSRHWTRLVDFTPSVVHVFCFNFL